LLNSSVAGDIVLSGQGGSGSTGVYLYGKALTVAAGNLTVQGASLVGGVATASPGSAATGGNYGFMASLAPIAVSGEIDIRGQGSAATYYGVYSDSTISSSAGNISLIGKGDGGVSFGAAVTAGSGTLVRNLTVIGTGTAGHGIVTTAAGSLNATGSVALTGYGITVGLGLSLVGAVNSTVAGDIVLSGRSVAVNAIGLSRAITATGGGIVVQGATLTSGVATAAPGTAALGVNYGLSLAAAASLNASGDINVAADSASYTGIYAQGTIVSTRGNVVLRGKGVDGVNLLGAVTVGSPGFVRSLTIAGTATTGTGLNTSAAVSATGAITLTGHTNTDDYGINVGSAITSTVAGDVILSGRSGGTNASLPVRAIGINLTNAVSVAGGNLIIQGAALAGGVASPVSGSAATGSRHGFTSTAAGDLLASGSISVSGHSGNHIGANITGDIISTDGNVTLFGSGPYGMNIAGEVRAGSGSYLR
jgi:hypothetical protein